MLQVKKKCEFLTFVYQKKEEFCIVNIKIKCSLSYREFSLF